MRSIPRHDFIYASAVYVFAFLSLSLLAYVVEPLRVPVKEKEVATETTPSFNREAFATLSLTAEAYVVYDIIGKEVIAGKNAYTPLPLASITKVMTALTALRMSSPETYIRISPIAKVDGRYDMGLKENQGWRMDELLKYSLTFSSNGGMYAIANHFGFKDFIARMNVEAQGVSEQLRFTDPAGLDNGGTVGGSGSAYDVALLMSEARKEISFVLDATTHQRTTVVAENGRLNGIPNTNQEINQILGAEASKTGFTDLAGGNLALVTDVSLGRPVVIVILGSTRSERFTDAQKIYKALRESLH